MMKLIYSFLFALILLVPTSNGQPTSKSERITQIKSYLSSLETVGFSGSVLIECDGELIISNGYGFSNQHEKIKNTPNTIFDIGSITKQFTAAAILKLEMLHKLSTDDKITKYFQNVPKDKETITIHDLLRHQSGLESNIGRDFDRISDAEFIKQVLNSKLQFEVGSDFSYSNIGYSLLTLIIEKVSNQSYENFLYEQLFRPAKMEMTGYTRPDFSKQNIAVGYYVNDSIWGKPNDKSWDKSAPFLHLKGNGGILSTTEDLYRWHKVLLTNEILSVEALNKYYHPKLRTGEKETAYYAYGWDVSKTERNTTRVWHNGSNRIFHTDFLRFIDEGTTMIMMSNKSHPNFNYLNFEIAKIIFRDQYTPEIPMADNALNRNFTLRIIKIIEESGLEKAKQEYLKKGGDENLLEFTMRNEGFNRIDNNKPEVAVQIFEMNVYVYPKSAKALQGLAEIYKETGKNEEALKYFKQSLAINPDNPFVKEMIKELEE